MTKMIEVDPQVLRFHHDEIVALRERMNRLERRADTTEGAAMSALRAVSPPPRRRWARFKDRINSIWHWRHDYE